jgi:hypothetical protein
VRQRLKKIVKGMVNISLTFLAEILLSSHGLHVTEIELSIGQLRLQALVLLL